VPLAVAQVHVSPAGSDENPGTEQAPVATLERARAIERARKTGTVYVHGGLYRRTATFTLGAEDSGTTWVAYDVDQPALSGSRAIGGWRQDLKRAGVWVANLAAQGVTDYGRIRARGFGRAVQAAPLELIYRGKPMRLAEWPDVGWAYTSGAPRGANGGAFSTAVTRERLERWSAEKDLWLHGYWTYDWADSYEHVARVEAAAGLVETDPPHGVYGYAAGKRFRVLNALCELDTPGEYWVDRASGDLYFYPPGPLDEGSTEVTVLETPLVTVTGANDTRWLAIGLENSRGAGIEVRGGSNNSVGWATVRNLGTIGVRLDGGWGHTVERCDIEETGEGGIVLNGGDRAKLIEGSMSAQDNHIRRYARWVRTYRPAVSVAGVGNRVLWNRIHHGPHEAIALSGNDHLIAVNDIHTAAWETADVGAFYMGRDWTWRGNSLRGNFFHNQGNGDVNSVYLDDCASGTVVEGNWFERAGRSVFIGGGRDNSVRGNVFLNGNPAVEVDARGTTWARTWFDGTDPVLFDRLKAMPYQESPWKDRYPELVTIVGDEPAIPKGNIVEGNRYFGRWTSLRDGTAKWVTVRDNTELATAAGALDGAPDLGPAGDVLNYRIEAVAGTPDHVRLVIENLGRASAQGRILLWAFPEATTLEIPGAFFRLGAGGIVDHEIAVQAPAGVRDVWVGARLEGEDLRPLALKLALK
jgi:hypothetical protein